MRAFIEWVKQNRTSSRLGLLLQVSTRILTSVLALLWTRSLLHFMGAPTYGLFLSFQSIAALGGLGDLGMGGAIGVRAGQYLGAGEHGRLSAFLASARTLFLILAAAGFFLFIALSPWLPAWLGFQQHPGAGSMHALFAVGGISIALVVISSYVQNLNHAALNFSWLVIPLFLTGQVAFLAQWALARAGLPLWLQQLSHAAFAFISILIGWWLLRLSQPKLAELRPLTVDWPEFRTLLSSSGWVYLCSLGNYVFTTSDRLLVNAGFGSDWVPVYQLNYKLCELSLSLTSNLVFIALPKFTLWAASSSTEDQARLRRESRRLSATQTLLGLAAAIAYLGFNDTFMTWWLGPKFHAPMIWQIAFALSLVITASADLSMGVNARLGNRGLSIVGSLMATCGLLNLILSLIAVKLGTIAGIAGATVIAQSVMSVVSTRYFCRSLQLPLLGWILRTWLLPVAATVVAGWARLHWTMNSISAVICYSLLAFILLSICALIIGVTPRAVRNELGAWAGMFTKR